MTISLHKPYLVKVTTKGEGVKNTQKFDHVVYKSPLGGSHLMLGGGAHLETVS